MHRTSDAICRYNAYSAGQVSTEHYHLSPAGGGLLDRILRCGATCFAPRGRDIALRCRHGFTAEHSSKVKTLTPLRRVCQI